MVSGSLGLRYTQTHYYGPLINMDNNTTIAGSIILAGIIIAGSLLVVDGGNDTEAIAAATQANRIAPPTQKVEEPRLGIVEEDHVFGNPNAPVTIIEYSDFECPFCARFHPTMEKLVREYPETVTWVYRQFPITSTHRNAHAAAAASECVALLAGNDAFWKFSSTLLSNQPSLGNAFYVSTAADFGVEEDALLGCMRNSEVLAKIERDRTEAPLLGANGTPFSIAILPTGDIVPIRGALPYEQLEQFILDFKARQ